ncbi:MAG TPA: oligoendopeptidase F, partial [Actinomycetota bacterium]|nr:oligoendopeptidase F [Actinomycetota bacterium]
MSAQPTGADAIAWDLTDLYADLDDPQLKSDLDTAMDRAKAFRERYRGHVAELDAAGLGAAVTELEEIESIFVRAQSF